MKQYIKILAQQNRLWILYHKFLFKSYLLKLLRLFFSFVGFFWRLLGNSCFSARRLGLLFHCNIYGRYPSGFSHISLFLMFFTFEDFCGYVGVCNYCSCPTLASLFLQISQIILTTNWYFWIQASLIWLQFLG